MEELFTKEEEDAIELLRKCRDLDILEKKLAREQHENMSSSFSSSSSFICSSYSSSSSSSYSSLSSSHVIPMNNSLKRCHSLIDLTNDGNDDNNVNIFEKPIVNIFKKNCYM